MILIIFLLIWLLGELFWQSRLKKGGTELEPWGSTINSDIQATGLSLLAILIILNPLLICLKLSFSTAFIGFGRDFVILFVFDQ